MSLERYLPAEWAPQSGIMLTWPHDRSDWRDSLEEVEPVFCEIARQISLREKVCITCRDGDHARHVSGLLENSGAEMESITLHTVPSNDTWARDHGPVTVMDNQTPLLLDFTFNGWGEKFDAELDNEITSLLHNKGVFHRTPLQHIDLVLEGGSIDSDGEGSLLTTSHCLLAPTRNPTLTRTDIESQLMKLLGIKRILWLDHGYLAGDDTDSHIDMLARFCNPHTIAYTSCDDSNDEHFQSLKKMEAELATFRTNYGAPYELVPLPIPGAIYNNKGQRLPASYANFLILNNAVLVPAYNDPQDDIIAQRLNDCFPQRDIIMIPCLPFIEQSGSLHCVTMQLPAKVL